MSEETKAAARKRASKTELASRIFTIMGWIVDGVQSALIVRQIVTAGWCDKRQAERLLKLARHQWASVEEGNIEQKRKLKVIELQQTKRSLKEEYKGTPAGIRAIMAVEKEIIRLENLAPAIKVNLSGKNGEPLPPPVSNTSVVLFLPSNGRELYHAK